MIYGLLGVMVLGVGVFVAFVGFAGLMVKAKGVSAATLFGRRSGSDSETYDLTMRIIDGVNSPELVVVGGSLIVCMAFVLWVLFDIKDSLPKRSD
jgi:hypothetical protein